MSNENIPKQDMPFIMREEYFGASVIRRRDLTFSFLNDWQTDFLKRISSSSLEDAISEALSDRVGQVYGDLNWPIMMQSKLENFFDEKKKLGMFDSNNNPNYEVRQSSEKTSELPHGILRSPIRMYFETTRRCNLHCKNCFSSSGKPYDDELTHGEVIKFLDALRKDNVLEVRITGGEPTQRPDWREIVAHSKSLGLAVSLNTNGIYSDKSVMDDILSLGVDQVIVSLDGNKEAHERLRGRGTYEKTFFTIQYLSERANNVRINTILKEESIPFIPELIQTANDLGTEMCFILLRPVGRGTELLDAIPSIKKLYDGVILIKDLRQKFSKTKIMTSYDVIQANANKPAPDLDLTGCSAGLRGMGVSSRGEAACCGFLAELSDKYDLGNIRDFNYSILDIWRNNPALKQFRVDNLEQNKKCTTCSEYEKKCFGTCVVMSVYKEVNKNKIEPYCHL